MKSWRALHKDISNCIFFSIQYDESTDYTNAAECFDMSATDKLLTIIQIQRKRREDI